MKITNRTAGSACGTYLGCFLLAIIINVTVGGLCFDYALYSLIGKDIPTWADCLCGLFLGEAAIPIAAICFILRFFIPAPFFPS